VVVKNDCVMEAVPNILLERQVVWSIVRWIDDANFVYRDDVRCLQIRDIHSEHAQHIATTLGISRQA